MSLDNARYMKKKIKAGDIDADPIQNAIIVNYEIEATILGDYGEALRTETKLNQKRIKIKQLNENTNIPMLAEEIVEKCKYIHPSKLQLVESILYEMQRRKLQHDYSVHDEEKEAPMPQRRPASEGQPHPQANTEVAQLDKLDQYIETFYDEDIKKKVNGASMILQLVRNPDNLEVLVENETLLAALSRLLQEDARKSVDLVITIVFIFYSFSNFSQFHRFISNYKVGAMIMKIVENEIARYNHWLEEFEKLKTVQDMAKEAMEEKKKKLRVSIRKQERLLSVSLHVLLNLAEDPGVERKMQKKKIVAHLVSLLDRKDLELLILAITFLKKLSIYMENKDDMISLGIAEKLMKLIPSENEMLLNVTLRLAFNLSFDGAFRAELVNNGTIPKLVTVLKAPVHRKIALQLLYLLSMDEKCRSMFTYADAIPLLMKFLIEYPEARLLAGAPGEGMMVDEYGNVTGMAPDMHMDMYQPQQQGGYPDNRIGRELVALAVNLAANTRNAELMCEKKGVYMLMRRVFQTGDPVLMKVIRNISLHDSLRAEFLPFLHDLMQMLRGTDTHELLVEVMGTVANVVCVSTAEAPADMDLAKLMDDYDLVVFLHKFLVPGMAEDDIVLESILLLGAFSSDPKCALVIANSRLIGLLYDLYTEKQEDDEIVLQITYTFYQLMLHEDTRAVLLSYTQLVSYLLDLLQDSNTEVRKMVNDTLDIIAESDLEWGARIRSRKFQLYNAEWLQAAEEDEAEMHQMAADLYQNPMGQMPGQMPDGLGSPYAVNGVQYDAEGNVYDHKGRPIYMDQDGHLYDAHGGHIMLAQEEDFDGMDWDPNMHMHEDDHHEMVHHEDDMEDVHAMQMQHELQMQQMHMQQQMQMQQQRQYY